jgi:uncharacterized protein (DUF305 family)
MIREQTVNKKRCLFAILLLAFSATLNAWQQDSHSHSQKTAVEPEWAELMGSMDNMHATMASVEPSGDADVDFVKLMLSHHQAALDMAKTELVYGKDPQMRRLAQEIIAAQQSEIETMQLWLKRHDPNSPK